MDEFKVVHFGEDESQPEPAKFANASEAETKRIEEIIPYMPTTFRGLLQAAITHGLLREEEADGPNEGGSDDQMNFGVFKSSDDDDGDGNGNDDNDNGSDTGTRSDDDDDDTSSDDDGGAGGGYRLPPKATASMSAETEGGNTVLGAAAANGLGDGGDGGDGGGGGGAPTSFTIASGHDRRPKSAEWESSVKDRMSAFTGGSGALPAPPAAMALAVTKPKMVGEAPIAVNATTMHDDDDAADADNEDGDDGGGGGDGGRRYSSGSARGHKKPPPPSIEALEASMRRAEEELSEMAMVGPAVGGATTNAMGDGVPGLRRKALPPTPPAKLVAAIKRRTKSWNRLKVREKRGGEYTLYCVARERWNQTRYYPVFSMRCRTPSQ